MSDKDKIKFAQKVAIIAGIFSVLVALLLLLNFWQLSKSDPIESKALEALVERLNQESGNEELKAEIRNFDLLARKAYFNSRWQVKTGAFLLLFGAIILVIALQVYNSLKAKIGEPDMSEKNEIIERIFARKGIIAVGLAVFGLALAGSFFTNDYLKKFNIDTVAAADKDSTEVEQVEVIEVIPATEVPEAEQQPAGDEIPAQSEEEATVAEQEVEQAVTEKPAAEIVNAPVKLTASLLRNNHNSFRGPFGLGVIYHKNIPVEWDGNTGKSVLWKTPVPKPGFNSPVIWDDKIFLAGADENNREVYCFNRSDGKLLWTGKAGNIPGSPSSPPRVTEDTGLSAPTVTTDGKGVYAIFATGDIVAFNMDGQRIWAKNLGVPDNHYGHSSSLITWDNKLFVQYDTNKGGKIMALETADGETVWETGRKSKISWASPVLVEVDGAYQLLLTADPIVAGYDVSSGKELWSVECMMGEVGPSVAYSNGIVFAANEYARMVAIDIKTKEILWEQDMYLPEASSPLAHNGLVIVATSYGVLACYDAKTGDQHWEHDVGTTLYSSPVTADGKLFLIDNEGVMRVYEFSKEMKLLKENELGEAAGTTPAFANGRIYIRGEKHLYCIGN
ncbi:MAG: PQQ-binding-like beta-propeller repeat protein [Prolixibacteraceae bacterium]|jgi:outer membrane protein assembly factor BamB|nr:PQQ-binding-like beta-propeller repeat protein [Prolixibacteraceae bacterium]MDD4756993.1 PQQ-binding-like beta-propeller repeat protein [Prolixibacteraceae bacterium]